LLEDFSQRENKSQKFVISQKLAFMRNTLVAILGILAFFLNCSPSNPLAGYYSFEDKTVFDLIDKLNKNPNDQQAAELLPQAYNAALEKRKETITTAKTNASVGDRWMEIAKEREVTLQMYNAIKASPAASKAVPEPRDPSAGIARAKENAAQEYYNQGLEDLNYNNRPYAMKAYDLFVKADKAVPGYKDVKTMMATALDKGTLKVEVMPVNYNSYGFNYWGYNNDWLQQQIVNDLNFGSYRDVKFYTDWQANQQRIPVDRVVDLNFSQINTGRVYSDNQTIKRSAQVQIGTTKSIPPQPIYETVYATVFVKRSYLQSFATLQCRIFDRLSGRNIFYDQFPGTYDWKIETATFRGDQRALTPADRAMINNSGSQYPPSRNEIADRLIRNCYNLLISRIKTGVNFQ